MLERRHLTHLEPAVASHLLVNRRDMVKKRRCSTSDKTKKYYQFYRTAPPASAVTGCLHYQVVGMEGTNLFLASINATVDCQPPPVFCPCNTRGRSCILCDNSTAAPSSSDEDEANDDSWLCECPCECPSADLCGNSFGQQIQMGGPPLLQCDDVTELEETDTGGGALLDPLVWDMFYGEDRFGYFAHLPPCFETVCSEKPSEKACLVSTN